MKTLIAIVILIPLWAGCKTSNNPSTTKGDAFHGGSSRIFTEQHGNVTIIWSASRRPEPPKETKPKIEK